MPGTLTSSEDMDRLVGVVFSRFLSLTRALRPPSADLCQMLGMYAVTEAVAPDGTSSPAPCPNALDDARKRTASSAHAKTKARVAVDSMTVSWPTSKRAIRR